MLPNLGLCQKRGLGFSGESESLRKIVDLGGRTFMIALLKRVDRAHSNPVSNP